MNNDILMLLIGAFISASVAFFFLDNKENN